MTSPASAARRRSPGVSVRGNLAGLLAGLSRPLPSRVRPADEAPDVDLSALLARVAAAGHPPETAAALADLWPQLPALTRRQVATPLQPGPDGFLRFGLRRAVQTSSTTCGSAVLVALLAAGDPVVAAWLVTGRRLGSLPREIVGVAGVTAADQDAQDAPARRFAAAQGAMQQATSRHALGFLSWPTALGTPPWTAARHARFPGVRYSHRPVDDGDAETMERLARWLLASVGRGVPVPLYTGGDLLRGISSAVPRHVVLAVPPGPEDPAGTVAIYEPSRGQVHAVSVAELAARRDPHAALGGWTHVCWAVLPRAIRSSTRPVERALR